MGVFKEMLADDRRVLVGLYISIRSWIYDGDKLFNDLKTRQAILQSTLFWTGNQYNNIRISLESCLRSFFNTSLAGLFWIFSVFSRNKMVHLHNDNCNSQVYWSQKNERAYELYLYLLSHVSSLYFSVERDKIEWLFKYGFPWWDLNRNKPPSS